MQKSVLLLAFLLLFTGLLFSDQTEDIKFIVGLYKDKNYRLAKIELIKFKDNYPESSYLTDVDFLLANIYLRARQYDIAQELYEILLNDPAVDITRPDILQGLAQTKYFQEEFTGSALLFNDFITEYPDHELQWNALYFLGRIAMEQGDYSSASYYYLEAVQKSNNLQISIAQLELYLETNNYEEAKQIILDMLKNNLHDSFTDQALIKFHNYNLKIRDFEEILLVGFEAIRLDSPYYDDYKLILGITRYEFGNYEMALSDLEDLISIRADYYKALCYVELNESLKAVELFNETQQSENIEISSNSYFYLARLSVDRDKAITMLLEFVETYPAHIFLAAAQYQLGFNYYQKAEFIDAQKYLSLSIEREIDAASREKAIYLIAESDFQMDHQIKAYQGFNEYIELYQRGAFADEALFKIGLYLYNKSNYPEAYMKFDQLIEEFPQSSKIGLCRFYIGEMFFDQNKYFDAEKYFLRSKKGLVDQGLVELRLAQIKFYLKEYEVVKNSLQKIPDNERYLFDKKILAGNLYFTLNQYENAVESYDNALKYAPSREAEEKVLNRKAWTLYQMKNYSKAAEIYKSLSSSEGQSVYLLKAASSAFSAQDYSAAIELYDEFIAKYPDSEYLLDARIGIANSHYNNKDFIQAALFYRELIIPETDPEMRQNSLNGLRWSCEQETSLEYISMINDILLEYEEIELRIALLKEKIIYHDDKGQWQESLAAFAQFEPAVPAESESDYFQIYKARALTRLNRFEEADEVFNKIDPQHFDADIYATWADLKISQKDDLGAIEKLRSASMKSRDYNIWLIMLGMEQKYNHKMFLNDYNKFIEFAGLLEKQQAMVYWIKWKINNKEYEDLDEVIHDLSESRYQLIKANAQFLLGFLLYNKQEYDNSIPELLRVRYLFPEIGEVRAEAEYYACLAYIMADRKSEAEQLYELIKEEMTPDRQLDIENGLQGAQF